MSPLPEELRRLGATHKFTTAQSREGNRSHPAAQLRLPENEGEYRNEEVVLRDRKQLAGVLRTAPEEHLQYGNAGRTAYAAPPIRRQKSTV